jgi:LysM repeat protein
MVRLAFGRLQLGVVAALVALPLPLSAQEARAESHTVREGDTLWQLARRYLGDPFLWPEIYRLNTLVVEDPHWIYPGEVLRLGASETIASVPTVDTPSPVAADTSALDPQSVPAVAAEPVEAPADMTPLFGVGRGSAMQETLRAYTDQPYRALRRSEFYSSGFLTEGQKLPFGRLLGRVTPIQISASDLRPNAMLYTSITVAPPKGAAYQTGDSLLIARLGPEIRGFGRVVIPTGLARVTDVADGRTVASVVALYSDVQTGDYLLPVEAFVAAGDRRAVAVADGIQAQVLGGPRAQVLVGPQDVIFLDKGRRDGVAPGDIFEARRTAGRRQDGAPVVPEVMATMQVVHVGERHATARVLSVNSPSLTHRTETRQSATLPS